MRFEIWYRAKRLVQEKTFVFPSAADAAAASCGLQWLMTMYTLKCWYIIAPGHKYLCGSGGTQQQPNNQTVQRVLRLQPFIRVTAL